MRDVALKLTLVATCSGVCAGCSGTSAIETARAYAIASINGDTARGRMLVTESDKHALKEYGVSVFSAVGEPATVLDSAVRGRKIADTLNVILYRTAPNWEAAGGRYNWEDGKLKDRWLDRALASSLPRVLSLDSVRLVHEDGEWRVWLNAQLTVKLQRLWNNVVAGVFSEPFASRVRDAREFVSLGGYADDSAMNAVIAAGPYEDSVSIENVRLRTFRYLYGQSTELDGKVVNHSHKALARVDASVRLTTGEEVMAWSSDIAPGRTGGLNWARSDEPKGEIESIVITNIELAR
ncbi:MAG TPA: hypothetical protein VFK04_13810 [Gemmatimonadaceae bacterium]|nr:hypothetical protein [Gemmatimonadaceae bacterium]